MSKEKQIIVGRYYNGYIVDYYNVDSFSLNILRDLDFYYDESVIYFSLIEENKTKKTIFKKYLLPPNIYYDLIGKENPNPMSMEPISFELKDLPESLNATDINTFDKEYNYNLEIKTNANYDEIEKAFLAYAKTMLPQLTGLPFEEIKNIFSSNPFDFAAFNKQTSDKIINFLNACRYKNPNLSVFISSYRMFILYKIITNTLNPEETPSSRRA